MIKCEPQREIPALVPSGERRCVSSVRLQPLPTVATRCVLRPAPIHTLRWVVSVDPGVRLTVVATRVLHAAGAEPGLN